MPDAKTESLISALPKAELHLHLEGAIPPASVAALAASHNVHLTASECAERYQYCDFAGFLNAFKWVTSFLRRPADYALATEGLVAELRRQNVVYAEVTLSIGVMLYRKQDPESNLLAIRDVARQHEPGLRLQWIFDATRQFGPGAAMEVARCAARMKSQGVVAFGMGGDELSIPAEQFRAAYDYARSEGLHVLIHAGEVGGPESIRAAIEELGAERIGHGIAARNDPSLLAMLAERKIPLEVCPTSNLCTGALALQLNAAEAQIEAHPLRDFFRRGLLLALSTDDPAMFKTNLQQEYAIAARQGLSAQEIVKLAEMSFQAAFLPQAEKSSLLERFRAEAHTLAAADRDAFAQSL